MSYYNYNNNRGGFLSNMPQAVKSIIIINVLVMVMMYLNENFMVSKFALFYPTSPFFHWWQPVTHMFLHGGFFHLFFNMYTLYIFGSVLEQIWGTRKFLLFYFVTGVGAAIVHIIVQYLTGSFALTVGASGAIYGILMGYAMLYPDSVLTLIFPPISLKAKWFVLIFAAIELALGVFGTRAGIAHFAHLGGLIFGFILIMYWKKRHVLYSRYD